MVTNDEGVFLTADAHQRMSRVIRWAEALMAGQGLAEPTNAIPPTGINVVILDAAAYPPGSGVMNAPRTLDDGTKVYHGFFCRRDITATDPDLRWLLDTNQPCWVESISGANLDPSAELFLVGFVSDTLDVPAASGYDGGLFALVTVIGSITAGKGIKISCLVECDPITGQMSHSNDCLIVDKATGDLVIKRTSDGSIVSGCDCDPAPP